MKNASAERARRTDKLGNAVRRPDRTRESMMRPARRRWPASLCEWAHRPPMLAMSWPDDGQPRAHRGPRPWTDLRAGALQTRRCARDMPAEPHAPCTARRHQNVRQTCVRARPAHTAPGRRPLRRPGKRTKYKRGQGNENKGIGDTPRQKVKWSYNLTRR